MGREIKRVPLGFDHPVGQAWDGYLMPTRLRDDACPDCTTGYSEYGQLLYDQWYGSISFDPAEFGSVPWGPDSPPVRERAERNIAQDPEYYGSGKEAIQAEAERLAFVFNQRWAHHLSNEDVRALVAEDRLFEFTHTLSREAGWQKKEPPVVPLAEEVNEWSIRTGGHDWLSGRVVILARCEREGYEPLCATCEGNGVMKAYEGQRAEAEAWKPTEPPVGEGWQLWETVTEGSPISPVCATPEELAEWMASPAYTWFGSGASKEVYLAFIAKGWAPSMVGVEGHGVMSGIEWVAATSGGNDEGVDSEPTADH